MTSRLSPRLALVIIAALFIGPLVVAWLMYSGVIDYRPESTRNLGVLIEPPRPTDWAQLTDSQDLSEHWVILHVIGDRCDSNCLDAVTALRQVHRAAGRDQKRIRIALLLPGENSIEAAEQFSAIHDAFVLLPDPDAVMWRTLEEITPQNGSPTGASYLADPLGNIMMYYEAGSDPNHIKKDLKRLLTWSKLDEN